ncbi:hypothetical protein ABZ619_11595 [Streptomyces sp. NPDC007851]|uniref:hypothetical protein n=1 Tax=Streptomyces sp. NPDC007851 TaxID=3155008 RepID=UPI0033C7AFE6
MWGLHALPDAGAPKPDGTSPRGRSARAGAVAPAEPPSAPLDDTRSSRDGSGSAVARETRGEPADSAPASGRRDGGAP